MYSTQRSFQVCAPEGGLHRTYLLVGPGSDSGVPVCEVWTELGVGELQAGPVCYPEELDFSFGTWLFRSW